MLEMQVWFILSISRRLLNMFWNHKKSLLLLVQTLGFYTGAIRKVSRKVLLVKFHAQTCCLHRFLRQILPALILLVQVGGGSLWLPKGFIQRIYRTRMNKKPWGAEAVVRREIKWDRLKIVAGFNSLCPQLSFFITRSLVLKIGSGALYLPMPTSYMW